MNTAYLLLLFSVGAATMILRNKPDKDWVRAVLVAILFLSAFRGGYDPGCHRTNELLQNNHGYDVMGMSYSLASDINKGTFDDATKDRLRRKLALMEEARMRGLRKVEKEMDRIDEATKSAGNLDNSSNPR